MMSPTEIAWRFRSEMQAAFDRIRIPLGAIPSLPNKLIPSDVDVRYFRTTDLVPGVWTRDPSDPIVSRWAESLRRRADAIMDSRLSFFNLEKVFVGNPVDWNRDHECGKTAPLRLSQTIDYRDYRVTGDAKVVWEPNRHHHLVVLGRAFQAFGDSRYAELVHQHIDSWIESNPFGYGMNWRSPLELGIRMINWVWALDLVRDFGWGSRTGFRERVLETVWRHLWEITRKYSRGSSANNHLIGEAAGVFVGSAYFSNLPCAREWLSESHDILSREILRQTYEDGCTREQAMGYHLFVLQFYLISGIVARRIGMDFSPPCWQRIEKMFEYARSFAEGGPLPFFGDCDDGYVLDLANGRNDVRELLSIGAVLFERHDFNILAGEIGEAAYWLLGSDAMKQVADLPLHKEIYGLRSRAFPESGHYLLQYGRHQSEDRVSLHFDCAELGYTAIAAHGHADALSFTFRVSGHDVFVDPGTFDYFTFPEWRSYFRSTSAHNTLEIDGRDQSEMLGPFLWGARAESRCTRFETTGPGGIVSGEHSGYSRLSASAIHSRKIEMDGETGDVTIYDEISSDGDHDVRIFFHVAEDCIVDMVGPFKIRILTGSSVIVLDVDPELAINLVSGSEAPIRGWVSRGYHQKNSTTTIVAGGRTKGNAKFRFRIRREGKEKRI